MYNPLIIHFGYILIYFKAFRKKKVLNYSYLVLHTHNFIQKRRTIKTLAVQSNTLSPLATRRNSSW